MPIQALNRLAARVAGKRSLRTVLIVPFVVQIVGTVGLVGYLSYKNGHQEVSNLATQLQVEINSRIEQHLDSYLAVPSQLNKINVDAYELKLLNFFDFQSTGKYFWRQLQVFNISYINFATPKGEFIGAGDYGQGGIQIEEIPKNSQGKSYKYDTDKKGDRTRLISVQDFDPHQESWYFNAVKAGKPVWSEIYNWDTNPEIMSIAASYPLYNENKTLIGVTGIDLKLSDISQFLKTIKIGKSGKAFILERSGLIVASSVNEPSFIMVNGEAKRLNATKSHTPAIQLTTQYLKKHFDNLKRIEKSYQLSLNLSGQQQYVQVSPWRDKLGLDWLVVVVIPKADFTEQINANTRTTILLCIAALVGSIGVGVLTARWITQPILRMNTAAKEIAKGKWAKPVEIERSDEVGELATSLNIMASQLQQSFTELNSLNAELAQRESQLRQFLDAIPVGVSIHEVTGKVLYFNQTAKQLLGLESIPDSANEELSQVYQLYRQNQLYPTEELPAIRALKGETVFVEDIELHRDGEIIPFELRATPIFDEQENIIYAITGFQDITERQRSKELLANYNRTLELKISERTAELVVANEQLKYEIAERKLLDGKLQTSTQQVRTIFESLPDIVLIIDEKKSLQIIPTKAIGWHADETNLLNWIVEPFFQKDTEEIWFAKVQQVWETQRSINFDYSLRIHNREIWYTACISPLTDHSVVWVARDISDRKLVEAALQASQSRFAGILEIANDAIITVDASQRITLFNQGAEKIFGYTSDEVVGQPLDVLLPTTAKGIHHQHVDTFSHSVGKARRMGDRTEVFGRRKDGTEFPAEASISKLEINGEKYFTTILRDISDAYRQAAQRKLAEEALRRYERIVSATTDAMSLIDRNYIYQVVNQTYLAWHNKSYEEIVGHSVSEILGTDVFEHVIKEPLDQCLAGEIAHYQDWFELASGRQFLSVTYSPYLEADQTISGVVVSIRNITELKQIEERLRKANQEMQAIFAAFPDILFRMAADGTILDYKTKDDDTLYTSPQTFLGKKVQEVLPPKVGEKIHAAVQQTLQSEFPLSLEYSLAMPEGEQYFEARMVRLKDNEVIAVTRNISDRKLAELALKTKTEELDRFFSASLDLLCIANTDGYFLCINPQWEKTLGYCLQELEGTRFLDYVHPEDLESTLDAIALLANQEEVPNFVNRYRCRDGFYRWIEWCSVPVGNLIYAAARDITERKQAEEALRQSEATNRAILRTIPDLLIWMNPDGTYLELAVGRDFQLFNPGQSYVGSNIYNVLPHPIAQQRMEYVQRALQTGELQVYEHQLLMEGEIHYEETRIAASENGKVLIMVRDITARKCMEESLREREEQLQLALEGSGDGFWDWKIATGEIYLSPRYLTMLGYEADELPVAFSTWERLIHPDDKPWVMQTLDAHLADSSVPYHFDYRLLTKSGDWKWIANYGRVVARDPNGAPLRMTGTHRDVSDRKQAEEALRRSEATKRQILTAMPDLLIWIDHTGTQLEVFSGQGFKNFIEPSKAIGRNVYEFLPLEMANQRLHYIQQALQTGALQIFEQQLIIDGEFHYEEVRVVAVDKDKVLAIIRDISERKQIELELKQAKEAAESANRAKSAFLANMSHELRTPLNGILGYAQILQRDKNATPKQKEGVDIIYQCGMHLLTLINDILDLSKIEAGKLELYPEDFNFPTFLTEITEIFRLKAIQKSLTFTYLPCRELPRIIHADEKRLRQVLMNLLSNAIKFTDTGSVTFKVEILEDVAVTPLSSIQNPKSKIQNRLVRFQVEDTGIGITPEQLEKIFLPFEQVGDMSRRAEGTGLGLAITQKIVELMEGQVLVASTPKVGSRFWFDLDVPAALTPIKPTPVQSTNTIIGYSGSKHKILIVDDRWENRAVFVNILEPIGFEVEQAADGQAGLEKALEFQPHLILADLVMPVMDGYEMTRQLRQFPELKNTIIIAISANAFVVDRQKSLESGCNDFLAKPVQAEDLLETIKSYLHLSWIYDRDSETQSQKVDDEASGYFPTAQTEMVIPSKEELLALYEAANTGYVQGVEQELTQLQQLNPDYTPFAIRMLELAADFEYEEIANLINRYLS